MMSELGYKYGEYGYEWDDIDGVIDNDLIDVSDFAPCPNCCTGHEVYHLACGEYIDYCNCPIEGGKQTVLKCNTCNTVYDLEGAILTFPQPNNQPQLPGVLGPTKESSTNSTPKTPSSWPPPAGSGKTTTLPPVGSSIKANGTTATTYTTTTYSKCSHNDTLKLPNDAEIICSSVRYKADDKKDVDFGLYADYSWSPDWRNEFIHWPDYGIPVDLDMALEQIYDAFELCNEGKRVEIGCIGGHGRTGTILGIMYVAASADDADTAIKWVHTEYCDHAIESKKQEWFIAYAAHKWFGHELPEKPKETAKNGNCAKSTHFAMMLRGNMICDDFGTGCSFWKADQTAFDKAIEHFRKKGEIPHAQKDPLSAALNKLDTVAPGVHTVYPFQGDDANHSCSALDHYAMAIAGYTECSKYGQKCDFWLKDMSDYSSKGTMGGFDFVKELPNDKERDDLMKLIVGKQDVTKDEIKKMIEQLKDFKPTYGGTGTYGKTYSTSSDYDF